MILIVKTVYGLFRMIKMKCIKFQAIPKRTITPIFPILDNIVQRYLTATIFGNNFSQFIKRFISFFSRPLKSPFLRDIVQVQYLAYFLKHAQKSFHSSFEVICCCREKYVHSISYHTLIKVAAQTIIRL